MGLFDQLAYRSKPTSTLYSIWGTGGQTAESHWPRSVNGRGLTHSLTCLPALKAGSSLSMLVVQVEEAT